MLVNYSELVWIKDTIEENGVWSQRIGVYQIPNLAIYLYIDLEIHRVETVEFDYNDQPELLEKDIPRHDTKAVYEWLRNEGYIYGEL